jgi:hypothetical protein
MGFALEGILKDAYFGVDGRYHDILVMAKYSIETERVPIVVSGYMSAASTISFARFWHRRSIQHVTLHETLTSIVTAERLLVPTPSP